MIQRFLVFVILTLAITSCKDKNENCVPSAEVIEYPTDSVINALNWPEDLVIKGFSGPKLGIFEIGKGHFQPW